MANKKVSLRNKVTLFTITVIFACVIVLSLIYYENSRHALMESLRSELRDVATALSMSVTPGEIREVLAQGPTSKAYWDMKARLRGYTKVGMGKIYGVYILVPTGRKDVWEFVADDVMFSPGRTAHIHEEYDVAEFPEMRKGLYEPAADREINQDKWGWWLSGYAPIPDEKGEPFAVLGVDMTASMVNGLKDEILRLSLLFLGLGAIFSIVLGRFAALTLTRPILSLHEGVSSIMKGKYGKQIDIKRNDELGDLIDTYNEMSKKLSQLDKLKFEFLTLVSHEFYTPLTPIIDGIEQLKEGKLDLNDRQSVAAIVENSAKRMHRMIKEVLDFSWLEIKEWRLSKGPVDPGGLVREMVEKYGENMISLDVDADLPLLQLDRDQMIRALGQLLDNSMKFSGPHGRISVSVSAVNGGVEIRVADDGEGIEARDIEKIFDGFYQAEDLLVRRHGGVSLGLAIAKRIVDAHGGRIRAESAGHGKGSCFIIFLPV